MKKLIICLKDSSPVEIPLTRFQFKTLMDTFKYGTAQTKDGFLIVRSVDIIDEKNIDEYATTGRLTNKHDKVNKGVNNDS